MKSINKETACLVKNLDKSFAEKLLERHFELQPKMRDKYGEKQIHHYIEDTKYHLLYLAEAIATNAPVLFNEYLAWAKTFFHDLPVSDSEILKNLELMKEELQNELPPEMGEITSKFIIDGIDYYKSKSPFIPSYITENNPYKGFAHKYLRYLVIGDKKSAHDLIMETVENGTPIKDLYLKVFQVTQQETGRLWQMNKLSVAQEHFITAATQLIMAQLYPHLFSSTNNGKKIIVTCVEGELHEIGARMVADIFEMEGWNSYYFGANTPMTSLLRSIKTFIPEVVAISTTMTFNLSALAKMIEQIKIQDVANEIKILVGGYPFLLADGLWNEIGADNFAPDALTAVEIAENISN